MVPKYLALAKGSGGGTSGRAMAFCACNLGSNPGTDLAFSLRIVVYLFLLGIGLPIRTNIKMV